MFLRIPEFQIQERDTSIVNYRSVGWRIHDSYGIPLFNILRGGPDDEIRAELDHPGHRAKFLHTLTRKNEQYAKRFYIRLYHQYVNFNAGTSFNRLYLLIGLFGDWG